MKRIFLAALLSTWTILPSYADEPVVLFAQDIPSSELVGLLYREIFRKPFVTAPSVQSNRSPVSVHIQGSQSQAVDQASDYLAALGFVIVPSNGVDRVELPGPPPPVLPDTEPFFYRAKWRDPGEIAAMLRPLFPEARFSGSAMPMQEGSSVATVSVQTDSLVVHAGPRDLEQIRQLLPKVDTEVSDLVVKAAVFEVGTDVEDGSAFQMAVSLLQGSVSFGMGSANPVGGGDLGGILGSFMSIRSSSIDAVVSALSTDARFNLVTAPSVRARSGSPTAFSVGQSVPVLGAVTFPNQGSGPVQSVEYRDAGVLFTVRPFVQERVITLALKQEISDFVRTTTGVNATPTLTRRALDTTLSLQDGDVIMLGGLTRTKDADAKEGFSFLPDFLKSNTRAHHRSDLLLILQVQKLDTGSQAANYSRSVAPVPIPMPRPCRGPTGAFCTPQEQHARNLELYNSGNLPVITDEQIRQWNLMHQTSGGLY